MYNAKLKGATEGLRSVIDSLGFFLMEKIEVLLDNEAVRLRLTLGISRVFDHEITIEFNIVYTSVDKPVKVR